jgi:indolepyruvate ferredoxin oxidoreductase
MPILAPGSVAETLEMGVHAIAMSRYSGLWTGLKVVADVADSSATVELPDLDRLIPALPTRPAGVPPVMLPPTNLDAEHDAMANRLRRALDYARQAGLNRVTHEPAQPKLAIVAAGMAYQAVLRALTDLDIGESDLTRLGVRLVQLGMPWPMDREAVQHFCADVEQVIVVEDKMDFLESLIRDALYGSRNQPQVIGKTDTTGRPLFTSRSTLTSDDIVVALRRLLPDALRGRRPEVGTGRTRRHLTLLPSRAPSFCSGCPHSASTRTDENQLVGVGIGCHIMVALEEPGKRGRLLGMPQMGGEGIQWLGLQPFTTPTHFMQNLGDGTFYHSGSLALRAAIAAEVDITYKLLFNDTVAMTGGQHPQGQMSVPALTRWLELEGVKKTIITTKVPKAWRRQRLAKNARVVDRAELQAAQAELARTKGVTVLLHIDRCATEERRLRKRNKAIVSPQRIWINERVCEGCGDCGAKSTCLSVQPVDTPLGRKTQIHQSSCNQDYACLQGDCPSFLIVTPSSTIRSEPLPDLETPIPAPVRRVPNTASVRMPGVGGTGVVTISQVLQMAAHLNGRHSAGLEQTGLAQKGGPVISDIRFSETPIVGQLKAGKGATDALIAFDALGASDAQTLDTLRPGAVAIVNRGDTPTAQQVQDVAAAPTSWRDIRDRIEQVADTGENIYLDALAIAQRYFADHMPANMITVGAAYQHGLLPLSADAIEAAIALNGAAVQMNLNAFRLGRLAVARPEALRPPATPAPAATIAADVAARVTAASIDPAARELVAQRATDLIGYQSLAYAGTFIDRVESIAHRGPAVTAAFAAGLYKLMAYKDEYEVARLHLDTVERARLRAEFGGGAKIKIMLLPPALRALGRRKKIGLGPWILPVLRALHASRALRGTRLDPFGYAKVRRVERSLVFEYIDLVFELDARGVPEAVMLQACESADQVRGYEEVKLRNVAEFRRQARQLLDTPSTTIEPATA